MKFISKRLSVAVVLVAGVICGGGAAVARTRVPVPVVVFPGFHFTRLEVTVKNQTAFPECPASGSFEDWYLNPAPSQVFSQVCQDKMLTLVYDPNPAKPMPQRFSNQPGVEVDLQLYGKTESAPYYEFLYTTLEAAGYVRNQNILVAGYDSRTTPDMDGFLRRTVKLIEKAYAQNHNTRVHLVGHSNGPFYAQYLLTHTSKAWKDKFIHGFTPLAGNWPGQGLFYPVFFTGFNAVDFTFPTTVENAASSGRMYLTHPSSYMSSADPAIFHNLEDVIQTPAHTYTPQDNLQLFQDAGLPLAAELAAYYTGFVKFADPAHFPNVDVYSEKGSGFLTAVGGILPNLTVGQVIDPNTDLLFRLDGDGNQEDITNDSNLVWQGMSCYRFEPTDNPNVDHFNLPKNPGVLQRLLVNLQRAKSVCP